MSGVEAAPVITGFQTHLARPKHQPQAKVVGPGVFEGIRQGLDDVKQGKVRPAREFFADFEAEHGIPR